MGILSIIIMIYLLTLSRKYYKNINYVNINNTDGKPVVKMVVYNDALVSKRIGVANGKLKSPEDLDMFNEEIAEMFGGTLSV